MMEPATDAALAPLTTLELGGAAEHLVEATTLSEVVDALRWARTRGVSVTVLGGGSNVVVSDDGVRGLVLRLAVRGIELERRHDRVLLTAAAGEPWDEVAAASVAEDLAGLECLSGIPGTAGATPIQNVGAYGQEVGAVIDGVKVLHRLSFEQRELTADDCAFGYRSSALRRPGNPWIVVGVRFALQPDGAPTLAYSQLAEAFPGKASPTLAQVRSTVLELRRSKSMVLDDADPNRRSVGSFFVNPVVDREAAEEVANAARTLGILGAEARLPMHELADGRIKLAAAWLIEHAGFPRGCSRGRVGLSTNHALALVNSGGATADELVAFARDIRHGVRSHLGIDLQPEPVFLGFTSPDPTA